METAARPLCVELDHALVRTDTFDESLVRLLRARPGVLPLLPFWLAGGQTHFREKIASLAPLDPAILPYDEALVARLRSEHTAGRSLWLAAGASRSTADAVAAHLGIFDGVLASPEREDARRFPLGFDDVRRNSPERIDARTILSAVRIHQWVKNILTFVPLLTAHRLMDARALLSAALAFVAFSTFASGAYVINDALDVGADRKHETKRHRPLASGALSIRTGLSLAAALLAAGAAVSSALPPAFGALLLGYLVMTLAYSLGLKARPVLDVLLLAALYTSRIFAGGFAATIEVTDWLAAFSMFLFLSLAFLKRASELVQTGAPLSGRGYLPIDREAVSSMGISSGYLSVLVLALYISSDQVRKLYAHPNYLWGLCVVMLYWLSEMWIKARRGLVRDDPVVFALRDRETHILAPIGALILFLATG